MAISHNFGHIRDEFNGERRSHEADYYANIRAVRDRFCSFSMLPLPDNDQFLVVGLV